MIREIIVSLLWKEYCSRLSCFKKIEWALKKRNINNLILDHFAIIDLPGKHTGIAHLHAIFSNLGFYTRGRSYLPDKQNEFLWMAAIDQKEKPADQVLPQVVIADFRLEAMPVEIKTIIEKYSAFAPPLFLTKTLRFNYQKKNSEIDYSTRLFIRQVLAYLKRRDWPLPTVKDFRIINEFNELLAWVLLFGRQVNHFALAIHLSNFSTLDQFNTFIKGLNIPLNDHAGVIKGKAENGIQQSATRAEIVSVKLADGYVSLPHRFIEFVWRYPRRNFISPFLRWDDYFTGFLAMQADKIIESLYTDSNAGK